MSVSVVRLRRKERKLGVIKLSETFTSSVFSILFSKHFKGADKENLFNNKELLYMVIISFTLVALKFDSAVIL